MRTLLLAAFLAIASVSCGNSATRPLAQSPVGEYVLTAIDKAAPPAALASGDSVIVGGAVLYASGAYEINWFTPSYYFGARSLITVQATGSWSLAGSSIHFSPSTGEGDAFTGAFTAPTLTLRYRASEWAFARR
jgi:hypothetical protein